MMREKKEVKSNLPMVFGKVLLAMYVVTGVLLVILAFLMFQCNLKETAVNIAIIVIYVVSGFLGGFIIGRIQKNRKYLWGAAVGLGYFVVLLLVSLLLQRGLDSGMVHITTTLILCTASGAIGGMLS